MAAQSNRDREIALSSSWVSIVRASSSTAVIHLFEGQRRLCLCGAGELAITDRHGRGIYSTSSVSENVKIEASFQAA